MGESFYREYEDFFRGSQEALDGRTLELTELALWLLQWKVQSVLDIGCGRGHFIRALAAVGARGTGIDLDPELVESAVRDGRDVMLGDGLGLTRDMASNGRQFDLVAALHLVEHMDPLSARDLVIAMAEVTRPGGHVLIITPNFQCPDVALSRFYRDPTHVRPYPKELLEFMMIHADLRVERAFAFDRTPLERLRPVSRRLTTLRWALDELVEPGAAYTQRATENGQEGPHEGVGERALLEQLLDWAEELERRVGLRQPANLLVLGTRVRRGEATSSPK